MIMLLLLLFVAATSQAEEYRVPLIESPIKIDGVLDDKSYDDALKISISYEIDPNLNVKAEVETTVYIIDRGSSIVFAFDAKDTNPEKIRAFLRDRDSAYQDDFVGVMLDTYNDERRALEFFVNPLGVQMDLIRDDANGGNEDDSWDAIWDSAGKINGDGFVVEMEIPYNELQMPNSTGEKTWGINLFRSYPRDVRKQLQATKLDRNNSCLLCQINKFSGFANAKRGMDLEITPSITLISNQRKAIDSSDFSDVEHNIEPSLDINWGINSNLTLNATFNPDFSQVEADGAQVDVNKTFALFFPEKRPFFLENSDYFTTGMNLIHTRNVANPDYGIRLVGKSNKNAYGFFYANDSLTTLLIPGLFGSGLATLAQESENLAARYRRDFGNASTIGAVLTRRSSKNYDNTVLSVDSNYRLSNENSLQFQLANSQSTNPQQITQDFNLSTHTSGNAYSLRYVHADENLFYHVKQIQYDDDFRADLGFIGRVGYRKSIVGAQYTWRPSAASWWNRFSIYSDWDITHDNQGNLVERELEGSINLNASKQSFIGISGFTRINLWHNIMYDETRLGIDASFQPFSTLRMGSGVSIGDRIDFSNDRIADRFGAYFFTNLSLGQHFNINVQHSFQDFSVPEENIFITNQTDLRLSYQFNIRQRLRLAIINTTINRNPHSYNSPVESHNRSLSTQLIYSYKVNPKTLLFLGYSDTGLETQSSDLSTTNRTLFAKFSYAWKK